jgi:hypothetical protein
MSFLFCLACVFLHTTHTCTGAKPIHTSSAKHDGRVGRRDDLTPKKALTSLEAKKSCRNLSVSTAARKRSLNLKRSTARLVSRFLCGQVSRFTKTGPRRSGESLKNRSFPLDVSYHFIMRSRASRV